MSYNDTVDVAIIGAGVIGLSVAWKIASTTNKSVAVVERHRTFGTEVSSRNSEVIHSGIYYEPEMLKSRMCIEGNRLLYDLCRNKGISHLRRGKFVIAVDVDGQGKLESLYQRSLQNGVNVIRLTGKEAMQLEPEIFACEALLLADSGVVDCSELMRAMYSLANQDNVMFVFDSPVSEAEYNGYHYKLKTNKEIIKSATVINCAGLGAEKVSALLGMDTQKMGYRMHPCKGEYFKINQRLSIHRLVYPVPHENSLGIHLCIDSGGSIRLGPNAFYVDDLDYSVNEDHIEEFFQAAHQYIPSLRRQCLSPDYAGIRPKIQGPGEANKDFIIKEESEVGYPGWINLIGIESPGLTSSLAIGEYVRTLI